MKSILVTCLFLTLGFLMLSSCTKEEAIVIKPKPYEQALRNPMKGFTTRGIYEHPWATLAQTYIPWNELENKQSDGIDKIKAVCNKKWEGIEEKNIKIIPRVYLHWNGDNKYWPSDLQEMDYSSEQFKNRVLRLIERLGECWDNDPRVAFVELGIFGKWGEHHSPAPDEEMQKLVGDAFARAFKHKKVSVRHNWNDFTQHPFGEYWDSWAHYDQMWAHGNSIQELNQEGRYLQNYVGGEIAYDWGRSKIQPGPTPTATVADADHRNFVINSIRWLHCTQLRWIDDYNQNNEEASIGAEKIQRAFGYRFKLNEVRIATGDSLEVSFDVTNTGSAPFYYDWPVELALLDQTSLEPVWKSTIESADIRTWLPGNDWTSPTWTEISSWPYIQANSNWSPDEECGWATPPQKNTVEASFDVELENGDYLLTLAILDPAGEVPSLRFATANYLEGGRHPFAIVDFTRNTCEALSAEFHFDDPAEDQSLHYLTKNTQ